MGSVRARKDNGLLFFDFSFQGQRCREMTTLKDNAENRRQMGKVMSKIEAEIILGTFEYQRYFLNSKKAIAGKVAPGRAGRVDTGNDNASPLLDDFAWEWFHENTVRWKKSYTAMVRGTLTNYLIPCFGNKRVGHINKGDILKFRSSLAKVQNGINRLSPDRINHILTPLRLMLEDAADRYNFTTPFVGIKQLPVPQTHVDPFSLDEVWTFINGVRMDFRDYYVVRFFTGMRTAEIDGLKWTYVDFSRREILIRETLVKGSEETTKNPSSARTIAMSEPVYKALKGQFEVTGAKHGFVFCSRNGTSPLNYSNVSSRIWYPTLKNLNLKRRRPYQTRHTAATLWLASGENPEWIARQMGHTTTKMLFSVYSRFVPNLTRRDGSAFENLLAAKLNGGCNDQL